MKPVLFSRLAVVAFAALTLSSATHAEPLPSDALQILISDVDAQIPKLMQAADVHGLTFAVVEHGDLVWSNAYGIASAELDRPTTNQTILEAASLGKVVFALIVLRLAEQGVVDLDESIAVDFEYPLLDHDARFAQLTPRLILQHASGLPNWGGYALAENRDPVQFRGEPGEGFGYSGEAYTALQGFVEARSGRSLEELFVELAADAGMTNSSFLSHKTHTEHYAQAWRRDGTERPILPFDRPGAAYSLISTAEDLARFTAYYFRHSGLSDIAFAESIRSFNPVTADAWGAHIPAGAEISWTLAWGLQEVDGHRVYFHGGNNGEFRSFFAYSAERDVGVALMANGAAGLSFLSEVFDPFLGDITPAAVWWGYELTSPDE